MARGGRRRRVAGFVAGFSSGLKLFFKGSFQSPSRVLNRRPAWPHLAFWRELRKIAFVLIGVAGEALHSSWHTPMHRACKFATQNLRRMSSLSLTGGFVVGDLAKVRAGRDHRQITSCVHFLLVTASLAARLAKAPPPRLPAR